MIEPMTTGTDGPTLRPAAPQDVGTLHRFVVELAAAEAFPGAVETLLGHLARLAVERGCGRLEWWVLHSNDGAIRFYERLRARGLDEIGVMRLDGSALERLGRG